MINCQSCGGENHPSKRFCGHCGAELSIPATQPSAGTPPDQSAGLWASIFDFSFSSLIIERMIKFLYGLGVILLLLGGLIYVSILIDTTTKYGATQNLFWIILVAIIILAIYLIALRISYELIFIFVRMADDIRDIRNQNRR